MRGSGSQAPAAPRRGRAPRLRAWGGVASLLFTLTILVVQLEFAAHLIVVQHTRCVHGELVHADGHAARDPSAPQDEPSRDAADRMSGSDAAHGDIPSLSHEDEHCDALAVAHRTPDTPAALGAATVLAILPVAQLSAAPEIRPIGLLDVAPKSSPPAV